MLAPRIWPGADEAISEISASVRGFHSGMVREKNAFVYTCFFVCMCLYLYELFALVRLQPGVMYWSDGIDILFRTVVFSNRMRMCCLRDCNESQPRELIMSVALLVCL